MFHGVRPCKNNALEGSEFCHAHQPNKPTKPRNEGKERRRNLMYAIGLQLKAERRKREGNK